MYIIQYNQTSTIILESNINISNFIKRNILYKDKELPDGIWMKFCLSSKLFIDQIKAVNSSKTMTLTLSKKREMNTIAIKSSGISQNGIISISQDYSNKTIIPPTFMISELKPLCVGLVGDFTNSIKEYKKFDKISIIIGDNFIAFNSALCDNKELKSANLLTIPNDVNIEESIKKEKY